MNRVSTRGGVIDGKGLFKKGDRGTYLGITREWLYWYNEQGKRLLTPEERVKVLAERLKSLGVDPDSLV